MKNAAYQNPVKGNGARRSLGDLPKWVNDIRRGLPHWLVGWLCWAQSWRMPRVRDSPQSPAQWQLATVEHEPQGDATHSLTAPLEVETCHPRQEMLQYRPVRGSQSRHGSGTAYAGGKTFGWTGPLQGRIDNAESELAHADIAVLDY